MKTKRSWLIASGGFIVTIGIALLVFERQDDFGLIRGDGVFVQNYSDSTIEITVATEGDGLLSALVSSPIGNGGFSKISFIPERWAVEFQRPFELWIFDGIGFHVFEKAAKGYKGTSSTIVPDISERAPAKLKEFADLHSDLQENKMLR